MRVVGGEWKGRTLRTPAGRETRPTTDRVREALFDALSARLGSDLAGERVLDAFAGSGALGIEALSRGAEHVTFVEKGRQARETIQSNLAQLASCDRSDVVKGNVLSLAGRLVGGPFTLIMLDPPYTLDAASTSAFLQAALQAGDIAPGAWVTWEHGRGTPVPWPAAFEVDSVKQYGSTEIEFAILERGSSG